MPNEDLRIKLRNVDSRLESVYLGALHTLNDYQNQNRIAQCAHSIRELTNILFRSEIEESKNKSKQTLVEKIQQKINLFGNIPPIYLKNFSKFNSRIHTYFVKVAHHGPEPTIDEFTEKISEYEVKLLEILEDYFDCFSYIQEVISTNKPTEENIPKLITKLKFNSLIKHFFDNISENWLQTLKDNEFFKQPPDMGPEGYCTKWYESLYLVRISNSKTLNPEIFYEIVRECKISRDIKKRNYLVIQDFLQIAINIEFRTGKKIVDFLTNNQLLKHESVEWINITQLLIQISKKYLQIKQFPVSIIRHVLEIRNIKKTYSRKRMKDDLIEEYNAFIINPLAYTSYEEFNELIKELHEISVTFTNHVPSLIKLIHNVLLDLIDKILIIERFSRKLEKPLVLLESKMILRAYPKIR